VPLDLVSFLVASVLVTVVPGADMALVTARSWSAGPGWPSGHSANRVVNW
jgi:threonine/homoserine/homoserine lactone efflux protein